MPNLNGKALLMLAGAAFVAGILVVALAKYGVTGSLTDTVVSVIPRTAVTR